MYGAMIRGGVKKPSKESEAAKKAALLRNAQSKLNIISNKIQNRLILTRNSSSWLPRLEKFNRALELDAFEKLVMLNEVIVICVL
jgi:hypothetical protein